MNIIQPSEFQTCLRLWLFFSDKCYLNNENSDNSQQLGSDGVRGLLLHGHVLHGWATPTPSACVHLVLDVGREQLDDQGAHALFQQDTKLKKKKINCEWRHHLNYRHLKKQTNPNTYMLWGYLKIGFKCNKTDSYLQICIANFNFIHMWQITASRNLPPQLWLPCRILSY